MAGEKGFYIRESILNLAICNTVIPEEDESSFKGIFSLSSILNFDRIVNLL
jgi:hypothetical protein